MCRRSLTRGVRTRDSSVLVYLVLYQPQILLDYAALVWGDGDPVDVTVGDREIVNNCVCRERDGHAARDARVARISDRRTLLM